jgi:CBS domain-containing protein
MLVRELMTTHAVTVHPDTTVKAALRLLSGHEITSMPVVGEHGDLVGVVSEVDLIRHLVARDARSHLRPTPEGPPAARVVADVMTSQVSTVSPDTDLEDAVETMTSTSIKSLPVIDDHQHVLGMLSRRDVVHVYARADESLARDIAAMLTASGHEGWGVEVHDGVASVDGPQGRSEQRLAHALAGSVAGVVVVHVLDAPSSARSRADVSGGTGP